jgi:hypothetical protein
MRTLLLLFVTVTVPAAMAAETVKYSELKAGDIVRVISPMKMEQSQWFEIGAGISEPGRVKVVSPVGLVFQVTDKYFKRKTVKTGLFTWTTTNSYLLYLKAVSNLKVDSSLERQFLATETADSEAGPDFNFSRLVKED